MNANAPDLHAMYWPDRPTSKRRPPWTWSILTAAEQTELTTLVTTWVHHYNNTYAVTDDQLIPPCWPKHPWLAQELAVMTWLHYSAHHDPTAHVERANEYYLRHLPAFRDRLPTTLGRSPTECRQGQHPTTWRRTADNQINQWKSQPRSGQTVDNVRSYR